MKAGKKILLGLLSLSLLSLAGCSQDSTDSSEAIEETEKAEVDEINGVSLDNPIKIDKEAKEVTVLSSVNGKYLSENTRHASVFEEGSNGDKSIFTAYASPEDFYNALVEIGAEPGDNLTPENAETNTVEGSKIKARVTWEGADKDYDVNEVIEDSNGKEIDFRFGGNLQNAKDFETGCLVCLDSCPVGIVSNASYTLGAVEERDEVEFTGNEDILPEDGTYLAVTYSLDE